MSGEESAVATAEVKDDSAVDDLSTTNVNPADILEKPACVDLREFRLKIDHFDHIHTLGDEGKIDGAPNFRKVNGFPVYGTGQPTVAGFQKVLDKVNKGDEKEPNKIIWFNMRQEPVVYLNGTPYAPRHPEKMHENLELSEKVDALDHLQEHFLALIKVRLDIDADSTLKVHRDSAFAENPMEREDVMESLKVNSLKGLNEIYSSLQKNNASLKSVRVPVVEERASDEECFDIIVNALKGEPACTQCIFSCQMGKGRTTQGMIVACLIKEILVSNELKKMGDLDLLTLDTVDKMIKSKFEKKLPKKQDDDDPLIKGEFDVIKELLAKEPWAVDAKKKIDHIIDVCGPPEKGTGLQNLRECIIETKWKYDVAPEEKQVVWRSMILNFMERYFYLICFAGYAIENGPKGYETTFKSWMDEKSCLRTMIDNGKDKIEWYRQVDPTKLNTLKDLINAPNYKENMGTLIKTIYEFAFQTYSDLPRGPIKNNSMRKLAAKTLVEILPPDIGADIQRQLDELPTSPDFVTLIGMVSYHGKEEV